MTANPDRLHVSIGELKTGRGAQTLFTTLGSCVGLAFLWHGRNLCGLAHCLLPEAPANDDGRLPARYVSQAVPALMKAMGILPGDVGQIVVVLVGGGNMTAKISAPSTDLIGLQNVAAAERHLARAGLRIHHRVVGGEVGRRVTIECATFEYSVRDIPRLTTGAAA